MPHPQILSFHQNIRHRKTVKKARLDTTFQEAGINVLLHPLDNCVIQHAQVQLKDAPSWGFTPLDPTIIRAADRVGCQSVAMGSGETPAGVSGSTKARNTLSASVTILL